MDAASTALQATAFMAALLLPLLLAPWLPAEARGVVPAIYIFGDSTADVGNNNGLSGTAAFKADYRPYGIDYPGGNPTGRFCNGYVGVDFLAMKLGFKESPPAALSVTKAQQENRGVNYASGGSGILDATGRNVSVSMNEQIAYFKNTVSRLARARGEHAAKLFLAQSIFIFSTVNNDLFGYFSTNGALNDTQNRQFIDMLTGQFEMQLKELYGLGARKFAIYGTGFIGCPPALRFFSPTGGCNDGLNGLSKMFNKVMEAKLQGLSSMCKGMKYSYILSAEIFTRILKNPLKYGFKNTTTACCGGASLGTCNATSTLCSNRDEYMWWDAVHPTQAAYKLTTRLTYSGSKKTAVPISFQRLVEI